MGVAGGEVGAGALDILHGLLRLLLRRGSYHALPTRGTPASLCAELGSCSTLRRGAIVSAAASKPGNSVIWR
jgi:hypothetical protein